MAKYWDCKYCDTSFGPVNNNGDTVCSGCGAEWEAAKILVEDEEGE